MSTKRRKKKGKNFKKFLLIYSGIFAIFAIVTWVLLFSFIKDYEEGQPKHVMVDMVEEFSADKLKELIGNDIATSEFESKDAVISYIEESAKGGELSYRKKAGEYSEETPVYELVSGKTPIAKVSLASNKKNKHKFKVWTIGSVNISDYISGDDARVYKITAPAGSEVTVNGIKVSDAYIKEAAVEFDPCKHVGDYVTKPVMTEYEIRGLIFDPQVAATLNGVALEMDQKEDDTKKDEATFLFPSDDALLAERTPAVESIAKNYGLYLINKLSLDTLYDVMIGAAADYVSDIPAIWAYKGGGHESFEDMSVTNCRRYSDDCFSVDVYYKLTVKWDSDEIEDKVYKTSMTYTYVKYNGDWRLADFVLYKVDDDK